MQEPAVIVEYKDKKNSSGRVIDGVIHLSISKHLSPVIRKEHIDKLTKKLTEKIAWAENYQCNAGDGIINTDEELFKLADTINKAYYNLPLQDASFHKQNSTWGTCSLKTKQIYISHRLKGAAMELLWYVVTHEICHLAVPSHNENFWQLVAQGCPQYKKSREYLKAYGFKNSVK